MEEPAEQRGTDALAQRAIRVLDNAKIPFLVAGLYAFEHYTGITRRTNDIDIFVLKRDIECALAEFSRAGYRTELKFPHWLGKVYHRNNKDYVDLIFNSGNGLCPVDQEWFDNAVPGKIADNPVKFCSPEEMIWQKAFVMERERYDGADVAHLLRAQAPKLDWDRLLRRFDRHWRVLLSHLILFGYIYPGERAKIPHWVYRRLLHLLEEEIRERPPDQRVCQGSFLSRSQYLTDIEVWGYRDARLILSMTPEETASWTIAAEKNAKE